MRCARRNGASWAPEHWKRLAGERLVVYTLSGSHESDIGNSPEAAARLLGQCLDEIHEDA